MARQSDDALSGLERELELYMGAEYETPSAAKIFSVKIINQYQQPVTVTFNIDETKKTGKIITSAFAYTATTGTFTKTTVTHNVPEVSQDIVGLKKKGDIIVAGTAPKLYFYDEGDKKVAPFKVLGKELAAVPLKFEIVEVKSILRASAKVGGMWQPLEYTIQEPVASQIGELKKFISGLKLDEDPNLEFEIDEDEYELDPEEDTAGSTEHFFPSLFGKKVDPKAEVLQLLAQSNLAGAKAFAVALERKIQYWINKHGPLELKVGVGSIMKGMELIALNNALGPAMYASSAKTRDDIIRWVEVALDRLSVLKDIAILDGVLSVAMEFEELPTKPLEILKTGIEVAKITYKAFTKSKEINGKFDELGVILLRVELAKAAAERAAHLKRAQAKVQELEPLIFEDLKRAQELEFEEDDDEMDDDEMDDDEEFDDDDELDDDGEFDDDREWDDDGELENELNALEDDGVTETFARQLHELSTQSFESEYELDAELDRALGALENEFMVKRLRRRHKRGKRKGLFGKILSTGAKIIGKVVSKTPVGRLIKAGTQLVRGNVGKALGSLAKAAIGVAAPGVGTVVTGAMDALGGGEEGEISRGSGKRRAMKRVARIARDTYREVADTLPLDFDHPLVAHEVATRAVHKAMIKNGVRPPSRRAGVVAGRKRIIYLKPGEKIVIIGR